MLIFCEGQCLVVNMCIPVLKLLQKLLMIHDINYFKFSSASNYCSKN
uniref:Uncharacterized protein n=1 Tax=Rhizophora mucronata TaxID=61149 RepID=A0A2P2NLI0_RHIMU